MAYVVAIGDENNWKGQWLLVTGSEISNYPELTRKLWDVTKSKTLLEKIKEAINSGDKIENLLGVGDSGRLVLESKDSRHSATERVYAIDLKKRVLTVLVGTGHAINNPIVIDKYSLDETEPNWDKVEALATLVETKLKKKEEYEFQHKKTKMRS